MMSELSDKKVKKRLNNIIQKSQHQYLLGLGSYGCVRKFEYNTDGHKNVAVKLFRSSEKDEAFKTRELCPLINTRNDFVKIIMLDNVPLVNEKCVVMELCDYDLYKLITDWIENDTTDTSFKLTLYKQILGAVNFLHENMIAHRDLKPQNIMILNNQIKIGDYGSIIFMDDPNGTCEGYVSTGKYSNPDVISGNPYNSFELDIWALGIIIIEMLTGDCPWSSIFEYDCNRNYECWKSYMSSGNKQVLEYCFPLNKMIKNHEKIFDFVCTSMLCHSSFYIDKMDNTYQKSLSDIITFFNGLV